MNCSDDVSIYRRLNDCAPWLGRDVGWICGVVQGVHYVTLRKPCTRLDRLLCASMYLGMWTAAVKATEFSRTFQRVTAASGASDQPTFRWSSLSPSSVFWRLLQACSHRHNFDTPVCQVTIPDSWRMKDQLDVTCYFISLRMCSTCFGH